MTRPIDLACPTCQVPPGRFCQNPYGHPDGKAFITLDYHHAARVDAAAEATIEWICRTTPVPPGGEIVPVYEFGHAEPRDHGLRVVDPVTQLKAALAESLDHWENFTNGLAKNVGEDGGVRAARKRIAELRELVKA